MRLEFVPVSSIPERHPVGDSPASVCSVWKFGNEVRARSGSLSCNCSPAVILAPVCNERGDKIASDEVIGELIGGEVFVIGDCIDPAPSGCVFGLSEIDNPYCSSTTRMFAKTFSSNSFLT